MTLIELMIVVAIIAILAAIGYPSYRDYVRRSHRAEGKAMLMDAAALQEKFFSNNNTYATTLANLGAPATSENGYYALSIPAADGTSFTLTVTAQGGQSDDTRCATMSITNTGATTATNADCW
jgi:type IV pilus assembly protein PilE